MMKHIEFLSHVKKYVEANPDVAAYVADHVNAGIKAALKQSNERAADMEVALIAAIAKRWPKREGMILDKLKKWHGNSCLNWDTTIKQLEAVQEKR